MDTTQDIERWAFPLPARIVSIPGVRPLELEVVEATDLGPHMRSIRLGGTALEHFSYALSDTSRCLKARGIEVRAVYADEIVFEDGDRRTKLDLREISNETIGCAFVAPGKTPEPILARWNQELVKALNAPDVRDELLKHGLTPMPGSREDLARYIDSESKKWAQVIKEGKITAN